MHKASVVDQSLPLRFLLKALGLSRYLISYFDLCLIEVLGMADAKNSGRAFPVINFQQFVELSFSPLSWIFLFNRSNRFVIKSNFYFSCKIRKLSANSITCLCLLRCYTSSSFISLSSLSFKHSISSFFFA